MYLSYNSNTNIFAYACYAILKTLKHLSNSILFLSMYVWYITIYGLPSMYGTSYLLIFQEMEKEYSGVVFIKVDVDENEVRT